MNGTEEGCGVLAELRERLGVWGRVLLNGCAERLGLWGRVLLNGCAERRGLWGPCAVERLCRETGGGDGTLHGSCCGGVVTVDVARSGVHCYVAQCSAF